MGSPNNPGLGRRGLRAALEPRLVASPVRPRAIPTAPAKSVCHALKLLAMHRRLDARGPDKGQNKAYLDSVAEKLCALQPAHDAQAAMIRRRMTLRSVLTEDET